MGKCPNCDQWNTFIEDTLSPSATQKERKTNTSIKNLSSISMEKSKRITSHLKEFDLLMGGGIMPGSLTLISGEPGIGKSTLLLQMANALADSGKVLYVSAEESEEQIKHRAERLNIKNNNLFILTETDIYAINQTIKKEKPLITIIDSIQTVHNPDLANASGNASQIRMCTDILLETAKQNKISIFIVGHVTKEGVIAGPKILEHMVDVVLYMEGEKNLEFRILKSKKNRFGSTSEIAVFEMSASGLNPVNNPSSYFIDRNKEQLPGSTIVTVMEGTRPILVELQSLVAPSTMAYPRRVAEGVDYNKLLLISAILEKIIGVPLNTQEIYLKVAGGLKINEPAIDLGIAGSILSSLKNKPLEKGMILIGEIGLTGEIRPVPYLEKRLQEIQKLGFTKVIIPKANKRKSNKDFSKLNIIKLEYINEIIRLYNIKEGVNV